MIFYKYHWKKYVEKEAKEGGTGVESESVAVFSDFVKIRTLYPGGEGTEDHSAKFEPCHERIGGGTGNQVIWKKGS